MDILVGVPTSAAVGFLLFLFFLLQILNAKMLNKTLPPQPCGACPVIGHLSLLGGKQHLHVILGNLADKHGPIYTFKMGVHRSLVIRSWELAKECFPTHDKVFANRQKFLAAELMGYNCAMIGFSPYGQYWRAMRKIFTLELLSNHRLQMWRHVRESEIQAALKDTYHLWEKRSKADEVAVVKMKKWFRDKFLDKFSLPYDKLI